MIRTRKNTVLDTRCVNVCLCLSESHTFKPPTPNRFSQAAVTSPDRPAVTMPEEPSVGKEKPEKKRVNASTAPRTAFEQIAVFKE